MKLPSASRAVRILVLGLALAPAWSINAQTPQRAPVNPAFLQHQQQRAQQPAAIQAV